MRRLLLVLLATAPLTGCQFLSAGEDVEVANPFEATQEAGEALIADAEENISEALDGEEAAFEDATVEAPPVVTADLIRSTDAGARTRQVSQSRTDPFASLPIPPAPEAIEIPAAAGNGGAAGANRGAAAATNAQNNNSGNTASNASTPTPPPVRVQEPNEPLVRPSTISPLPAIPQPVIAPTVSVSGIIQLGGEPYAIIAAGGEPERYVRVGDRIAGGSVRVKRIDTLAFEPQVILEENGIEVSRPIRNTNGGDDTEAVPPEPVAALPVPQVPISSNASPQTTAPGLPPIVPVISPTTPTLTSPGEVPGSLLLLPPDLSSQATLPNMQVSVSA